MHTSHKLFRAGISLLNDGECASRLKEVALGAQHLLLNRDDRGTFSLFMPISAVNPGKEGGPCGQSRCSDKAEGADGHDVKPECFLLTMRTS